ncbi:hypothetical protein COB11_07280 [Candidatus Aerophobetes bacterium]|uniref:Uncharacterized protein n=1 Tax=Aerophobetes bacterium TaxID=2030807 RepID=A0A2A4YDC3_UNCAE|nr:MAG: hypothetical protein COB11_07280 [Candidatus Aerophobetes bacterium]
MTGIPSYITYQRDPNAAVHAVAGKHGSVDLDQGTQATIIDRVYKYMEQDSVRRQLTQHFNIGEHANLRVRVQGSDVYIVSGSGKSLKLTDKISQDVLAPVHAAKKEREATFRASAPHTYAASTHGAFSAPSVMPAQQPLYGGAPMAHPPGHTGGFMPQQMMHPMMPMMGYPMMMPSMMGGPMMYPPQGQSPYIPPQSTPDDGGVVANIHGTNPLGMHGAHDPVFLKLLEREQAAHEAASRAHREAEELVTKGAAKHYVDNTQKLLLLKGNLGRSQKELEAEIATYEVEEKTYAPGWLNYNRVLGRNRIYYDEVITPQLKIKKDALALVNAEMAKIDDLLRLPKEPRLQKEKFLELEAHNKQLQVELVAAREKEKAHPAHAFHSGHRVARHHGAAPMYAAPHTSRTHPMPQHAPPYRSAHTTAHHAQTPPMYETRFHTAPITTPFAPRHPMAPPTDAELGFHPAAKHTAAPKAGLYPLANIRAASTTLLDKTAKEAQRFLRGQPASKEDSEQAQADLKNINAELKRREAVQSRTHTSASIRPAGFESGIAKEVTDYTDHAVSNGLLIASWDPRYISRSVMYLKKLANDIGFNESKRSLYQQWHDALQEERLRIHNAPSYTPDSIYSTPTSDGGDAFIFDAGTPVEHKKKVGWETFGTSSLTRAEASV